MCASIKKKIHKNNKKQLTILSKVIVCFKKADNRGEKYVSCTEKKAVKKRNMLDQIGFFLSWLQNLVIQKSNIQVKTGAIHQPVIAALNRCSFFGETFDCKSIGNIKSLAKQVQVGSNTTAWHININMHSKYKIRLLEQSRKQVTSNNGAR